MKPIRELSPFALPPLPLDLPVRDLRAEGVAAAAAHPVEPAFHRAFVRRRLERILRQPGLDEKTRLSMAQAQAERLRGELPAMDGQPAPGGLGYGFYYTQAFREAWDTGTIISCDYVSPHRAGGDSRDLIYLTSMNRAAWGCEPLVQYQAQSEPMFRVWDWALANQGKDPWCYAQLLPPGSPYVATVPAHGERRLVVSMVNATFLLFDEDLEGEEEPQPPRPEIPGEDAVPEWRNVVLLRNVVLNSWDVVHVYDYYATMAQQKPRGLGDAWGPIVETFQAAYHGTNPMGALETKLAARDMAGAWSNWALLAPADSYASPLSLGFTLEFVDANYAFVAVS
jgi:hypothetical protein